LGLNGAMVPLVLCGPYVCSPELAPSLPHRRAREKASRN
jgi:hypothetical protein